MNGGVDMRIDGSSSVPIYQQIAIQLKDEILKGNMSEGEMLPSIRGLAKELRISVITTMKAYELLQEEGLIQSIPGKGYYVSHVDNNMVVEQYQRKIEDHFLQAIRDARIAGISNDELKEMLDVLLSVEEKL